MNFHKGIDWYASHFNCLPEQVMFDPTYSYIRSLTAPQRIYDYNPNARIMLTVRNPIERAFSHYWHEKKKDRFNFDFKEVLVNYDLFNSWVEPGLYVAQIKRYLVLFPYKQVKILFLDDLEGNPTDFFKDVCQFCDIDPLLLPGFLAKKINPAGDFQSYQSRLLETKLADRPILGSLLNIRRKYLTPKRKETLLNIENGTKKELLDIFMPEICELETLTNKDLSAWKVL